MSFAKKNSIFPGLGLSLDYTIIYLSLIVLIPLSAVIFKTTSLSFSEFLSAVTSPRVMASYRLSFGMALFAGLIIPSLVYCWPGH